MSTKSSAEKVYTHTGICHARRWRRHPSLKHTCVIIKYIWFMRLIHHITGWSGKFAYVLSVAHTTALISRWFIITILLYPVVVPSEVYRNTLHRS